MEFPARREAPEAGSTPSFEVSHGTENIPFQSAGAEPTSLPLTETPATEHVIQPYNRRTEVQERTVAAAAARARLPLLTNEIDINGPARDCINDPFAYKQALVARLTEIRQREVGFAGESGTRPDEQVILEAADQGIDTIGQLTHVEVRPADTPIRLFDKPKDHADAIKALNDVPDNGGLFTPFHGILWQRRPDDPVGDVTGLTHERIHSRSKLSIVPTITSLDAHTEEVNSAFLVGIDGILGHPSGLNEAVTEMATARIRKPYGPDSFIYTHTGINILTHEVIIETARTLNMDEVDVELALYRSMLGGEDVGIEMIGDVLGPTRSEQFLRLQSPSLADTVTAAGQLHLPEAAKIAQDCIKTNHAQLFSWQPE